MDRDALLGLCAALNVAQAMLDEVYRPTGRWTADSAPPTRNSRFDRGCFGAVAGWRGRSASPAGTAKT